MDVKTKVEISASNPTNEVKFACTLPLSSAVRIYQQFMDILTKELNKFEEHQVFISGRGNP